MTTELLLFGVNSPGTGLSSASNQRVPVLLFLLSLCPTDLLTELDRIRPRRFKDGVNLLERQLASLGEDEVRRNELEGVVHNVHNPDLVPDLLNAHANSVRLDHTRRALNHVVETHTLGTQRQGEDLDGV